MLELLKKFVSQDDPRKYMRSPFTRGEWTYATNGHIAVRVPKIDGVEILPEKHIPNLDGLFQSAGDNDFIALPWMPPLEECLLCGGTGAKRNAPAKVGGSHFDLFYLHLINGLPGAKFSPGARQLDMARFVFDGGEGILMPMRAGD